MGPAAKIRLLKERSLPIFVPPLDGSCDSLAIGIGNVNPFVFVTVVCIGLKIGLSIMGPIVGIRPIK